jgi:hypothetical protein
MHAKATVMFKTGWLRRGRIYSRDGGFTVGIEDRTHMAYRSGGKKMTILGELLKGGAFAANLVSTTTWDDGTPVETSEQNRIINNVKQAFAWQGEAVDFD